MLNLSPSRLPSRHPHLRRGLSNSPMAHMATSMLILALGSGVAIYNITMNRVRAASRTHETLLREHAVRLERLASGGNVPSQLELASVYSAGLGVEADQNAAARWNRTAAENGSADGQLRFARALLEGQGVQRDINQATAWLRKAAEKGSTDAQCTYGIYRFLGIGTDKDVVEGYRWIARAAAAGSDSAVLALENARGRMTSEQIHAAEMSVPSR